MIADTFNLDFLRGIIIKKIWCGSDRVEILDISDVSYSILHTFLKNRLFEDDEIKFSTSLIGECVGKIIDVVCFKSGACKWVKNTVHLIFENKSIATITVTHNWVNDTDLKIIQKFK